MIKKILKTLTATSVFILIFTIAFIPKVKADIWGGSELPPPCPNCGSGESQSSSELNANLITHGYRVSIVDSNGNMVDGTRAVNYWYHGSTIINRLTYVPAYGISHSVKYCEYKPKTQIGNCFENNGAVFGTYTDVDKMDNLQSTIVANGYGGIRATYGGTTANAYAKYALEVMYPYFEKNKTKTDAESYSFAYPYLVNAGYTNSLCRTGDKVCLFDSAKNQKYYLMVEPTSAIFIGNTVYVGTSAEISTMGGYDSWTWRLRYVSYGHPFVYANGGGEKVAGINTTPSLGFADITKENIKSSSHPLAVFILTLENVGDNKCVSDFEKNKNKIENDASYRDKFIKENYLLNGYDSNGNLGALSTEAIKLYGFPNNATIACSNYDCNQNATKIKEKYYGTALYESVMQKLKNAVIGKNYNLLNTEIWTAINPSGPKCGKTEACIPTKNINCDTDGTKTLVIADSNEKRCWYNNEIGYYRQSSYVIPIKAKDEGCTDGVENSCNTYRDTGCKIVCRQVVTFDFPGNVVTKVKAGMVFKWGTNTSKSSNLFGKMKVTMSCQVKAGNNDCRTRNRVHEECDHATGWQDSKPTCAVDLETREVNDLSSCKSTYPKGHEKEDQCAEYNKKTQYKCTKVHSFDWKIWTEDDGYLNSTATLPDLSNLDTKVNINYNLRYSVNGDLTKTLLSDESQNNGATVTCDKGSKNNCKLGGNDITNRTQDVIGTYKLNYTDKFNWYSSKLDGTLYDKDNYDSKTSSDSSKKSYYYYIGYSMPTSFKTHSGTYNDKLVATVSNVGFNDHFDSLLGGTGSFVYSCGLKIHNEIYDNECYDENGNLLPNAPAYCLPSNDPKGIDVVFREVQLINGSTDKHIRYAFPGAKANAFSSGKPRQKGANWAVLTNQEIYNVLNVNVYNNKPMYEIKLDTRVITNIRNINKKAKNKNKDPYSGMHDMSGNNKTLAGGFIGYKCSDGVNGKYCASSFLSELYNKYGLTGECIWTSNTSDRANRIANGTYKKCKNV